jgi:hypothetical protein
LFKFDNIGKIQELLSNLILSYLSTPSEQIFLCISISLSLSTSLESLTHLSIWLSAFG